MTDLQLPAVLAKGDNKRVAHTSSDYWSFVYNGFKPTGEAYEGDQGELSPAESDPELPAPVEVVQRPRPGRRGAEQPVAGDAAGGDSVASPEAPNA
jgi:hypothetical protein